MEKELGRSWKGPGMVSAVTDSSFDVYIPEFGLVERIQCTVNFVCVGLCGERERKKGREGK